MSLDGKNNERIGKDNIECYTVYDGWIYYINMDDYYKLYKIKTDGSSKTKLSDDSITYKLAINRDRIYYINESDNNRLYSIGIDGNDKQPFADYSDEENVYLYSNINSIQIHGDVLFYVQNPIIHRVNLDGTNLKSICHTFSSMFVVDNKWLFTYDDPKYTWVGRIEIGE